MKSETSTHSEKKLRFHSIIVVSFFAIVALLLIGQRFEFIHATGVSAVPIEFEIIEGEVVIEHNGTSRTVSAGETMRRGETIKTLDDGRAILRIGQTRIGIDQRTNLRIDRVFDDQLDLHVSRGRTMMQLNRPTTVTTGFTETTIVQGALSLVNYDFLHKVDVIPFSTDAYRRDVVDYMFREFEAGRTPNPDVMCNKYMKFDLFLQEADKLGCDYVATGHYARVQTPPELESLPLTKGELEGVCKRGSVSILTGIDEEKDQTYFLWAVNPDVIPRVLFPIGDMKKSEVREKARELKLVVADKRDSTGICFVGEVEMRKFLQAKLPKQPGKIVTTDGEEVGEHEGLAFYTIGQRHGLHTVGGGTPYYVVEKRKDSNELVVSSNFHPKLFEKTLTASNCNWFRKPSTSYECRARIRYRQALQKCKIIFPPYQGGTEGGLYTSECVSVEFDEPQRAVTPGQSIVFYDGEEMLGGGIID